MLINATIVIKFSVGGDWDLFGDQSREIETRNYEKDKHNIQALIVELYLHVSGINYDGCPVMIDKMSTSKYQRWRSTIAHAEGWYRQHLWWNEYLWKRTSSVWIFWCDCCWQSIPLSLCDHHIRLSPASLQNSTSSPPAQQPDTCSQCFFPGSATSCKMADGACGCRFQSNASVLPSLIFCRSKRATLPPASAARVPYHYHCFYPSSSTSYPSFPVPCFRLYA